MSSPLSGITIIDLSHVLAGPYCTMVMADLGARVIKVELPQKGDDTRHFPPLRKGKTPVKAPILPLLIVARNPSR